jgi:hypothetical protein
MYRWGWNARNDFPRDRDTHNITWGKLEETANLNAWQHMKDNYEHRMIGNYGEWDYDRIAEKYDKEMPDLLQEMQSDPVRVTLSGRFSNVSPPTFFQRNLTHLPI